MVPQQVRDYHFCSCCLFWLFHGSSSSLLCCSFFSELKVLIWRSFFDLKEKRRDITPTQRVAGVIGARSLHPLSSRCKNLPPPMPLCMFTEISVKTEEWETQTQIDVLTRLKSMACKGMKTHQEITHAKQGSYTILKKICKTGESHFHEIRSIIKLPTCNMIISKYNHSQSGLTHVITTSQYISLHELYTAPTVLLDHISVTWFSENVTMHCCFFWTKSTSWFLTKLHSYLRWQIDFERDSAITMKMYVHSPCQCHQSSWTFGKCG